MELNIAEWSSDRREATIVYGNCPGMMEHDGRRGSEIFDDGDLPQS